MIKTASQLGDIVLQRYAQLLKVANADRVNWRKMVDKVARAKKFAPPTDAEFDAMFPANWVPTATDNLENRIHGSSWFKSKLEAHSTSSSRGYADTKTSRPGRPAGSSPWSSYSTNQGRASSAEEEERNRKWKESESERKRREANAYEEAKARYDAQRKKDEAERAAREKARRQRTEEDRYKANQGTEENRYKANQGTEGNTNYYKDRAREQSSPRSAWDEYQQKEDAKWKASDEKYKAWSEADDAKWKKDWEDSERRYAQQKARRDEAYEQDRRYNKANRTVFDHDTARLNLLDDAFYRGVAAPLMLGVAGLGIGAGVKDRTERDMYMGSFGGAAGGLAGLGLSDFVTAQRMKNAPVSFTYPIPENFNPIGSYKRMSGVAPAILGGIAGLGLGIGGSRWIQSAIDRGKAQRAARDAKRKAEKAATLLNQ